jgi:uncharacterized protein (UPF0335 family)
MAEVGGIAAERLRSFIERIERLEEEKAALAADIREVYAEAKSTGFDVKTMRQVIRLRKLVQAGPRPRGLIGAASSKAHYHRGTEYN